MVIVEFDKKYVHGYILLQPNLSLGWRANVYFLIIFSSIILTIAAFFSVNGKWPVLLFSAIELTFLFISLRIVFRHFKYREVIRFTLDSVIIEKGIQTAESIHSYKRLWSKFYIDTPDNRSLPGIFIRSHKRETEIGELLNYSDKQKVISALKKITLAFKSAL